MKILISTVTNFSIFFLSFTALTVIFKLAKDFIKSNKEDIHKKATARLLLAGFASFLVLCAIFVFVDFLLRIYILSLVSNFDFISVKKDYSDSCECDASKGIEFCNSTSFFFDSAICHVSYY